MITLKESLLSNTKDKVDIAKNKVKNMAEIPSVKDFYRPQYNPHTIELRWHCEELLKNYRIKYPKAIVWDDCHFSFQIDQSIKTHIVLHIFVVNSNDENNYWLTGWSHRFKGANLRVYKKDVIKFIETLVDNPDKFDVLFSHTEDCKKSTNYFIEKDLLNL